ncbi:MAG: 2-iminoacetate synthase ThiH [Verrucomicrobiae bacterium]|nr:2-iminoacetate synthase ThiH [Verrucomicrobiae bacterium]
MSFTETFNSLSVRERVLRSESTELADVRSSLSRPRQTMADFERLISPAGEKVLEELCRRSSQLTRQRFGKVIRLFAPLYLSNECINNCAYCGFSRDNPILRVTLSVDEVVAETRALKEQGFRNVLLVAGEHPKFVSNGYLAECIAAVHREVPGVSLEVGPMETPDYEQMVAAGSEGLVVYQETYDREIYGRMHTLGPKRNFDWRLETPERASAAGFRRLGIGALFGLADWRYEAICVAAHAEYLLKHCWKSQVTISLPRLRPCAGEFQPLTELSDRHLVQLICAFRIFLPDVGIVLSTREPARLRDGLLPLGITLASAGSHTEPGGYTGAGRDNLHHTVRGRVVDLAENSSEWVPAAGRNTNATGQFDIADERSPADVAKRISSLGFEPVWKDWDAALTA